MLHCHNGMETSFYCSSFSLSVILRYKPLYTTSSCHVFKHGNVCLISCVSKLHFFTQRVPCIFHPFPSTTDTFSFSYVHTICSSPYQTACPPGNENEWVHSQDNRSQTLNNSTQNPSNHWIEQYPFCFGMLLIYWQPQGFVYMSFSQHE